MVGREVRAPYSYWFIVTLPAVREVYGVCVERVPAFRAVVRVGVVVKEGGEVLEEEVVRRPVSV